MLFRGGVGGRISGGEPPENLYLAPNRSLSIPPKILHSIYFQQIFGQQTRHRQLKKHCHARLRRFCIQILFCVDSGILSDSRNDLHVECDLLSCVCKGKTIVFSYTALLKRHPTNKHTTSHTDGSQRKERSYKEGEETVYTMFYCKCVVHFGAVVFTCVPRFDDERDTEIASFDPYKILDLDTGAELSEIKKQYRKLSLKYHPTEILVIRLPRICL